MAHKVVVVDQMAAVAALEVTGPNITQHVGSGTMAHAHLE